MNKGVASVIINNCVQSTLLRAVSSTVERLPYKQDVTSSNLVLPIFIVISSRKLFAIQALMGHLSHVDRRCT